MSEVAVRRSPWQSVWRKAAVFAESIKFEHTIFALPFAYLTLFLVEDGLPHGANFAWITVAMAAARTFAMAANRLIDAEIDARNPRTRGRAMPVGLLSHRDMLLFMAISLTLFLVAVYRLSPWAGYLWPAVIAPMILYPYLKRFTWLSHLGLGVVYLIVPTGVWIAVANELTLGSVLLGLAAGLWVAGFDLIYATQDVEFDRRQGLHSLPARFGLAWGLLAAKGCHLLTVGFIAAAGPLLDAWPLYYLGAAAFLLLLAYEHRLVSPRDLSRVNVAFFNMNGIVGVLFFLFVVGDVLLR